MMIEVVAVNVAVAVVINKNKVIKNTSTKYY